MMQKIAGGALIAVMLATAMPVLAEDASPSPTAKPKSRKVDLACMQTAVEKRDNSIIAAWDTLYASVKTALTTRRDALKAAWGIEVKKDRRAALNSANKAYRTSKDAARKTFHTSRKSVWDQYRADAKACRTTISADDITTATIDANL